MDSVCPMNIQYEMPLKFECKKTRENNAKRNGYERVRARQRKKENQNRMSI